MTIHMIMTWLQIKILCKKKKNKKKKKKKKVKDADICIKRIALPTLKTFLPKEPRMLKQVVITLNLV